MTLPPGAELNVQLDPVITAIAIQGATEQSLPSPGGQGAGPVPFQETRKQVQPQGEAPVFPVCVTLSRGLAGRCPLPRLGETGCSLDPGHPGFCRGPSAQPTVTRRLDSQPGTGRPRGRVGPRPS